MNDERYSLFMLPCIVLFVGLPIFGIASPFHVSKGNATKPSKRKTNSSSKNQRKPEKATFLTSHPRSQKSVITYWAASNPTVPSIHFLGFTGFHLSPFFFSCPDANSVGLSITMSVKGRVGVGDSDPSSAPRYVVSRKWTILLCIGSFCAGMFFTNRMSLVPEAEDRETTEDGWASSDHYPKLVRQKLMKHESNAVPWESSKTDSVLQTIKRTVSKLEMELTAARLAQDTIINGSPLSVAESTMKRKYLMVIGINTAFNSRKRRDSIRATWMPQGYKRKKLEEEKGVIIRFVIGHSSTSGDILDRAIEAEDSKHGDFLRLEHVEGYMELSAKTKTYFATAVGLWDADFYVKVDDDVHVNIAILGKTLARYRLKPRVYIGCMKCGPILARKGIRYHEPEHWKFGGEGNKYFRHATGQLYSISRDLATYISINQHMLHKYANEDVSLGSWLIGLDVVYIDDRRLCCGTPPDCELKAQAGNICAASFDWNCSGICRSAERIYEVHQRCGEGEDAL
ncbi:Beta-1,3-galactosyltransferase 2 [Dionaea muscipula]